MSTIKLTKEEMNLLSQLREKSAMTIKGRDNKSLLIKRDSQGKDAISILEDGKQQARCVLNDDDMIMLGLFYRRYIGIYNLKKGDAKISETELSLIKEMRYDNAFKEMCDDKNLNIVFKFIKNGLFLQIRNKARTNICSIELNTNESIEFRKFLLGN